jgi:putative DNA primase/helicase
MSLAEQYLIERGIPIEIAIVNGIEFDSQPSRDKTEQRLGVGCVPLWKYASEILWLPVYTSADRNNHSWIARGLPTIDGTPKFVAPTRRSWFPTGIPYVPIQVWNEISKPSNPVDSLVLTEGPVKSLVLVEAGVMAVGLNGVFGAHEVESDGKLILRKELIELGVRGGKVYLFFDADASLNPEVRRAEIRLWFMLRAGGAEVFRGTSWDPGQGKGIDDFLVNATREDPDQSRESIVEMLIKDAQPFVGSINKRNTVDLDIVTFELEKIAFTRPQLDQLCKELAEPLGMKVDVLRRVGAEVDPSHKIIFEPLEPWPNPVSGNDLALELVETQQKHIILSDDAILTVVLWGLLTSVSNSDAIDTLPFLTISSPEKRCGKSRLQTVLGWMSLRPLRAANISSAAVYRTVEACSPTLLLDEVDTFVDGNEELRGILNSGHTRETAFVIRCNPVTLEPERFSVWCPKSIALIGTLSGTLADRSIEIRMERKKRGQKVSPLRATPLEKRKELMRKILRWSADYGPRMAPLDPATLDLLNDRAADNWAPILQVAELLGPPWKDAAYAAMRALNPMNDRDAETQSPDPATVLLTRLRQVFYDVIQNPATDETEAIARGQGESEAQIEAAGREAANRILKHTLQDVRRRIESGSPKKDALIFVPTTDILDRLNEDKEAPWFGWSKGKQEELGHEKLSRMLRPYKVKSIRLKRGAPYGYTLESLLPVFERYLEDTPDDTAGDTSEKTPENAPNAPSSTPL